jgi:hypothetical protein
MATRPIICPPVPASGFIFFKDKFVLEEDYNMTTFFDFKNMIDVVSAYSRLRVSLDAGKSIKISQTDLADEYGYVKWIAVKVKYPTPIDPILYGSQVPIIPGVPTPTNGTPQVQKYITWTYQGKTYNIGQLMVLSGPRVGSTDADQTGWNLSGDTFPYNNGGITFTNPHTDFSVKLEILVAR